MEETLLHFTKSEIYYVLTKMSSGKFLINIHFADIYHFLLISIITQNAQSNYYYLKCFHHLTLTWMIQAGLFLFIISASFILQIHYIEKGIFHSVNLNKKHNLFLFHAFHNYHLTSVISKLWAVQAQCVIAGFSPVLICVKVIICSSPFICVCHHFHSFLLFYIV